MGKIRLAQTGEQVQSDLNFAENMFTIYDASSTYAKDNVVRYGDKLYKCKNNNTTGAWDSTKWDEVKLNNLLGGGTKLYRHYVHNPDTGGFFVISLSGTSFAGEYDSYYELFDTICNNSNTLFINDGEGRSVVYDEEENYFMAIGYANGSLSIYSSYDDLNYEDIYDTVTEL